MKRIQDALAGTDRPRGVAAVRHVVWRSWLRVLLWAAGASWKAWLVVLAGVLAALVAYVFAPPEEAPAFGLEHELAIESDEFLPSITGATDTPFLPGNHVDVYNNGDEFYPAMLEAIDRAHRSITMEAYIYWSGDIGKRFADALAAKADAGVTCKLLLDAVGSSAISDDILAKLESGGCEIAWYHPVHWYTIHRANNRTHRKSLIVDGEVGFTGGAGIADQWQGHAQDPEHWRDIHIRIEGPAVATLQAGFGRNWLKTTGGLIAGPDFYPVHRADGPLALQSVLSSPETGASTVRILYYLSIASARKSIRVANPYFVPDEQAIELLVAAEQRGVDVKIMLTGIHNDNKFARYSGTRLYGKLLEGGVEIYEYNKTMMHQKYMVCDGIWSTIGTTNFDNRSFALNDENNVSVYDRDVASGFDRIFSEDLGACDKIELAEWRERGLWTRIRETLVALLRSQL